MAKIVGQREMPRAAIIMPVVMFGQRYLAIKDKTGQDLIVLRFEDEEEVKKVISDMLNAFGEHLLADGGAVVLVENVDSSPSEAMKEWLLHHKGAQ